MPAVTVSQLIARAKATADIRDNFVTPDQWMQWASQERLALDLFIARSGWTLPLSDFDITVDGTEAGVYAVNPDSGVMAIVDVVQYDSAGRTRRLKCEDAVSFHRRNPGYSGSPRGNSMYYRVTWSGDSLSLNMYPEPATGETYRVIYIAHPATIENAYSTVVMEENDGDNNLVVTAGTIGPDENGLDIRLYSGEGLQVVPAAAAWAVDAIEVGSPHGGHINVFYDEATYNATWQDIADAIDDVITSEGLNWTTTVNVDSALPPTATFVPGDPGYVLYTSTGGKSVDSTVHYPMGWEERIVLGMARRALMKEESDTRAVDTEIALWESRIEEACWNRVLSNAPSVRNSDQVHYGWADRYSAPPYGLWTWV